MNESLTSNYNEWYNSTADGVVIIPSTTAFSAGAIAGVFVAGVLLAALVITIVVCKYKPRYFLCFRQSMQDDRRGSNIGLTHTEDEETEINNTNVLENNIHVEDDYFYDEVFERSAFTDEATNDSITNLYNIPDDEDDVRPRTSFIKEGHI